MSGIRYGSLQARLLAKSQESEVYSFEGTPCWEWNGPRIRRGYGRITMWVDGKNKSFAVHRVVAELVAGRKLHPDRETIEHCCEVPWCINPWHFGLGTRADNVSDAHARRWGRPRKQFTRLVDPATHRAPWPERGMPVTVRRDEPCPF